MCSGFEKNERDRRRRPLKIKAFYLRLSVSKTHKPLPDSLTLHYLPRINGSPLDINGANIRSNFPGFVTLHRVVSATGDKAVFGSRDLVRACEGVRFEVYLRDEKLLRGGFRKEEGDEEWKMECKCVLERETVGADVKDAEVFVEVEGQAAMSEKVAVRRKRRGKKYCFQMLEEIPEEREVDGELKEREGRSDGGDGGKEEEEEEEEEEEGESERMEMEIEGVRLAVDVGMWVVCFGVGYLVSSLSRIKLP